MMKMRIMKPMIAATTPPPMGAPPPPELCELWELCVRAIKRCLIGAMLENGSYWINNWGTQDGVGKIKAGQQRLIGILYVPNSNQPSHILLNCFSIPVPPRVGDIQDMPHPLIYQSIKI
jgi:hypothetical protein